MYPSKKPLTHCQGFTLAELLIALAILGVIATFTIPKIITAQQNQTYNATTKEAIATLSAAYQSLKYGSGVSASTTPGDFFQYINYVKLDTSGSQIDDIYTYSGGQSCGAGAPCLRLANGTAIRCDLYSFGGTATTNALELMIDPDGQYTSPGNGTGPGKSIRVFLYYSGKITTLGTAATGTQSSQGYAWSASPSSDPPWFSW